MVLGVRRRVKRRAIRREKGKEERREGRRDERKERSEGRREKQGWKLNKHMIIILFSILFFLYSMRISDLFHHS